MTGRSSSAVEKALKLLRTRSDLSAVQICARTGIAVSSLYRAAKRAGIPLPVAKLGRPANHATSS